MVKKDDIKKITLADGSVAVFVGDVPDGFDVNATAEDIVRPYIDKSAGTTPVRTVVATNHSLVEWSVDGHLLTKIEFNSNTIIYILTNNERTFQVELWYE